jgi:ketosteroid isomerase-like protein
MDLDATIARYHRAADEFSRGDPEPMKSLCSRADDVTLANPFGPARRGWGRVEEALTYAAGRMHDGNVARVEELARYVADDLATIMVIEHWQARVGDAADVQPFELRVSTTFRREGGDWKVVHRHADPIATDDPSGPLRAR